MVSVVYAFAGVRDTDCNNSWFVAVVIGEMEKCDVYATTHNK